MVVERRGTRLAGLVAAAVVAGLVVGGCAFAKSQPSPIVVVVSPGPTVTVLDTSMPTTLPSVATAVPSATVALSPTPSPSPTAPPHAPAVPATACTGSADNQAFWASASADMSWDVYCPVLPSGWFVSKGSFEAAAGGTVSMSMNGPSGARLSIQEGAFCTTDAGACSPHSGVVGTANFGDLPGTLNTLSGGELALYVNPGSKTGYTLTGSGVSQAGFVSIAAAMVKVAKS
jgi:hypothetical protein